jgi:hypothetical protein
MEANLAGKNNSHRFRANSFVCPQIREIRP